MAELSSQLQRELIFVEERMKEIAIEMRKLEHIRSELDGRTSALLENEKRLRLYSEDRIPQLNAESKALIDRRQKILKTA